MGPTSPRVVTKLTTRKTANSFLWLVLTGARTTSERFSGHPLAQTLSSHRRWRYPTSFPPIQRSISILNPKTTILTLSPTSLDHYQIGFSSCMLSWHVLINYFRKRNIIFIVLFKILSHKFLNSSLLLIIMNEKKSNLCCEFKLEPIITY